MYPWGFVSDLLPSYMAVVDFPVAHRKTPESRASVLESEVVSSLFRLGFASNLMPSYMAAIYSDGGLRSSSEARTSDFDTDSSTYELDLSLFFEWLCRLSI